MTSGKTSPAIRLDTLPPGMPKRTLAKEALAWAHRYLLQPNGPEAGKPWRPRPRQLRFWAWWYAVDEDGQWLFDHGVRRLAKGSGKSPSAAVAALIEFAGPCRVADIDGDRVLAKPVDMPLVQIAATAESQTANTMRNVRAMAAKGSLVVVAHGLDPGKTVYYRAGGGELHTITSSADAQEGAETTFAVLDETEHWTPSMGGLELAQVMDRNLAKSGSRAIETCNAWRPGAGSVAEVTWDAYVAQVEGRSKGGRTLYDALIAPPDTDLSDPESLTAALEFVYADCPWVPIEDIRRRIWDRRTPEDVSRRFYLNQPTATEDAWVTPQEWAVCAVEDEPQPGDRIAMFFDGSLSADATALVGCRISDGLVFPLGVWEPTEDRQVPVAEVDAMVATAFDTFDVAGFFADVREWESFTKSSWPAEYQDRLTVWAVPSGKDPQPIAWDMRGHVSDFTAACELTEAEIRAGELRHDGNSVVTRHVGNARRRVNRWGVSIGKESRGSSAKIDAAVCVIGARMVRRLVLLADSKAESGKRQRTGSYAFF